LSQRYLALDLKRANDPARIVPRLVYQMNRAGADHGQHHKARDQQQDMPNRAAARGQAVLHKKRLDGGGGELDTQDLEPLIAQPEQIETLAAQGREHAVSRGHAERGPMATQTPVDARLMKCDLAASPALEPELRLHDAGSNPR